MIKVNNITVSYPIIAVTPTGIMAWTFDSTLSEKLSTIGWVVPGLTVDLWCVPTRAKAGKKDAKKPLSPGDLRRALFNCPLAPGNIMMWAGSVGGRSATPFAPSLLCCFLSLVALCFLSLVLGFHRLRDSHAVTAEYVLQAALTFWEPRGANHSEQKRPYRLDLSTEENYKAESIDDCFCESKFANIRRELDYDFHQRYRCSRQLFQDSIIESLLESTSERKLEDVENQEAESCTASPGKHWAVFTAGVMGAGKSYTIRKLDEKGVFPLSQFVVVDPDAIRRRLPEFERYVQVTPARAGELTRKEAGKISEILTTAALQRGQNVLVDGSLRNSTWYLSYFESLREKYPHLQIGILHVTAPREAILERAMVRTVGVVV
jgi:Zeta toxin